MTREKSKWGFSVSERRALLFILTAFLVGWGYRLYQNSRTLDALPLTPQDSVAVASIRTTYLDGIDTGGEWQTAVNDSGSSVENQPDKESATLLIDINSASQQNLESLPGIGAILAKRIVEEREKRNGFRQIEEILEISGIGEGRFKKIRPLICCNPLN